MKAYHAEGWDKGGGGGQQPQMERKCVAGRALISVIYKAGHVEIKNIRKMVLGESYMISWNLHKHLILYHVGRIQVGHRRDSGYQRRLIEPASAGAFRGQPQIHFQKPEQDCRIVLSMCLANCVNLT